MSASTKGWLILAAGAAVGFVAKSLLTPLPSPPSSADQERFLALRAKIASLADGDVEDYLRLKGQEAKYSQADELLGKALAILLADLGLKVSPKQASLIRASVEARAVEPGAPEAPAAKAYDSPTPAIEGGHVGASQ